jgi:exosortase/archaeosortase family protein
MQKSQLVLFFAKALGVYVLWYILYDLWILPDGRVDLWLSEHIVSLGGSMLAGLGFDVYAQGRIIGLAGTNMLEIIDGCNGIEVIGLFAGFVLAYPGRSLNRLIFIPAGILVLYLTNVVRILVLAITQLHAPGIFTTHDSTTAIFYVVVFLMWVVWVNFGSRSWSGSNSDKSDESGPKIPVESAVAG